MVVGESALGKSTLINTLFSTGLYQKKQAPPPDQERSQTVSIESISSGAASFSALLCMCAVILTFIWSSDIEENGVRLRLTVVDTPGYGDFVNNSAAWQPILENIESRFDAYLEQENRVNRAKLVDNRIHALIYFIEPTGHALKPVDIEFMRMLHDKVNLIPVIAKADTMTEEEVQDFKKRVRFTHFPL